ncbi:MAG: type II secretion system protein [Candidatus Shapirobacteria bacterium]|jgi:prepilin-type N-terminal cleavage/methylation domain-containing protein
MKKRVIFEKGFTLVELLIVIALIAILSVAVLATINPIEQTNKARDAKFKNDAAEVLSAIERYYASQTSYSWNVGTQAVIDKTADVAFESLDYRFGIIGDQGSTDGDLISTSELKGSFKGKESFVAGVLESNKMYVFHNGTSGSNYVCFHPAAKANRKADNVQLKCISGVSTIGGAAATATLIDQAVGGCTVPATWTDVISATDANLLCVPEGLIN